MNTSKPQVRSLLFVCLGNICRSPMAETVMQTLVENRGLGAKYFIDSAGLIDYHEGDRADGRMRWHAERRGYSISHRSRPIDSADFENFDYIIGMDDQNIRTLQSLAKTDEQKQKIHRMIDYCPDFAQKSVPDPYYGGAEGFELVIDMLEKGCETLLDKLEANEC